MANRNQNLQKMQLTRTGRLEGRLGLLTVTNHRQASRSVGGRRKKVLRHTPQPVPRLKSAVGVPLLTQRVDGVWTKMMHHRKRNKSVILLRLEVIDA